MTLDGPLESSALAGKPMEFGVIDIHAHIGALGIFHAPRPDAAGMLDVMERTGVKLACISANDAILADMAIGNDLAAAAMRKYPGRFAPYAVANPNHPARVIGELKRCFDEHGFRMIKIHPSVHCTRLTDPAYDAVFDFAARRGAPVLTHTWQGDEHCGIDIAAETAQRHAGVSFLWGHSGGGEVRRALEAAAGLANVYLELAASQVWSGRIETMTGNFPVERIVWGSDFPFISLPQQLGQVVFARISDEAKRMILSDNAQRILTAAGVPCSD